MVIASCSGFAASAARSSSGLFTGVPFAIVPVEAILMPLSLSARRHSPIAL